MDEKEKEKEKRISYLELEGEELDQELSVTQKKALIANLKKSYGRDWKKVLLGAIRSLKIDKETLHTLHGMGVNTSLREYNDPRIFSKRRNVEEAFKE